MVLAERLHTQVVSEKDSVKTLVEKNYPKWVDGTLDDMLELAQKAFPEVDTLAAFTAFLEFIQQPPLRHTISVLYFEGKSERGGTVVAISPEGAHIGVTHGEKTERVISFSHPIKYKMTPRADSLIFDDWKKTK